LIECILQCSEAQTVLKPGNLQDFVILGGFQSVTYVGGPEICDKV